MASLIIDCDPPGIASNDLSTFTFKKKDRKLYPLDDDAAYPDGAARLGRVEESRASWTSTLTCPPKTGPVEV